MRAILKEDQLLKHISTGQRKPKSSTLKRDETEYVNQVLRCDMRHSWCLEFLKEISNKNRLPPVDTLALRYMPESEECIQELFELCLDEVDKLFLNNYVAKEVKANKREIEPYFGAINHVIPKVNEQLWIEYFKISSRQVAQIIRHCNHLKSVRFEW